MNIDKIKLDIICPKCNFYNRIFLKQILIKDVIICRGCKINLQLIDYMNEYGKTRKYFRNIFGNKNLLGEFKIEL